MIDTAASQTGTITPRPWQQRGVFGRPYCPGEILGDASWKPGAVRRVLPNPGTALKCPVCGDRNEKPEAFYAAGPGWMRKWLLVRQCTPCGSLFFDPLPPRPLDRPPAAAALDAYIERGADLETMAELLWLAAGPRPGAMRQIRNGYGYALDFWENALGGKAVGEESSNRAEAGRRDLGIRVEPGSAEQCDVVVALEGMERAIGPRAFIQQLAASLKPGGRLVIATPDAGALHAADTLESECHALLNPGCHRYLLSESALREALLQEGFIYCEFRSQPGRLQVIASREPLHLSAGTAWKEIYAGYLRGLMDRARPGTALHRGAGYRLFQSSLLARDYQRAEWALTSLRESLRIAYGGSFAQLPERLRRAALCQNLEAFQGQAPTFLSDYEFLLGLRALQATRHPEKAAAHFQAAGEMALRARSTLALATHRQPLYWQCRFQEAQAILEQGGEQVELGLRLWKQIARETGPMNLAEPLPRIPATWRNRAFMARLRWFVAHRRWNRAREELSVMNAWLEESGHAVATADAFLADLRRGHGMDDALWYLHCRGSVALNQGETQAEARRWFTALVQACELLAGTPEGEASATLYRNALFHAALAAESAGELELAGREYAELIDRVNPRLGQEDEVETWACRARERLAALPDSVALPS